MAWETGGKTTIMQKVSQSTEGKETWESSQKRSSLIFWKLKVKKGRSTFRFAKFCYCNLKINVMLVLTRQLIGSLFQRYCIYLNRETEWPRAKGKKSMGVDATMTQD